MTTKEAIEILTVEMGNFDPVQYPCVINALQLGIEALKNLQHMHTIGMVSEEYLLPSETKED